MLCEEGFAYHWIGARFGQDLASSSRTLRQAEADFRIDFAIGEIGRLIGGAQADFDARIDRMKSGQTRREKMQGKAGNAPDG